MLGTTVQRVPNLPLSTLVLWAHSALRKVYLVPLSAHNAVLDITVDQRVFWVLPVNAVKGTSVAEDLWYPILTITTMFT